MVEDCVQINKEVLLELCTYMRERYRDFDAAGKYTYVFHLFKFGGVTIWRCDDNVEIDYSTKQVKTFYDELTKSYYFTRENYLEFNIFLGKIEGTELHHFPNWYRLVDYFNRLTDAPMIKAAK